MVVELSAELYRRLGRLTDLGTCINVLTSLMQADYVPSPFLFDFASKLVSALTTRFEATEQRQDLDTAVALLERLERELPADVTSSAEFLLLRGRTLEFRAIRLSRSVDLDSAIDLFRRAAAAGAPGSEVRHYALGHLGSMLRARSEQTSDERDIDAAVDACRGAVEECPPSHPQLHALWTNLAAAHSARYRLTGRISDIDAEIAINRQLLETARTEDPEYLDTAMRLGAGLVLRFRAAADPADLDVAIAVLSTGLEIAEASTFQAEMLERNLRAAHHERFGNTHALEDFEAAAHAAKANVSPPVPPTDPEHEAFSYLHDEQGVIRLPSNPSWNDGLTPALMQLRSTLSDIPATTPGYPYVQQLKKILGEPPETLGGMAGLQKALDDYKKALTPLGLPMNAAGRIDYDTYLEVLRAEYREPVSWPYGPLRVQTEIDLHRENLVGPEPVGPQYASMALGCALLAHYEYSGELVDLDAAIRAVRAAMTFTQTGDPEQATQHRFLADALWQRHERTGEGADLTGAITELRHLARMFPPNDSQQGRLHFLLACAHRRAFDGRRHEQDRADAVRALQEARTYLESYCPEHALYGALVTWWSQDDPNFTGPIDVLQELIGTYRVLIDSLPPRDPDRVGWQSDLGELLRLRHRRTGDRESLEAALDTTQHVVEAMSSPRAADASELTGLGDLLRHRYHSDGDHADLEAAIDAYTRASTHLTAAPHMRIHAARATTELLMPDRLPEAARALTAAVQLLPATVSRQRSRELRQVALSAHPGLVADAVALRLSTAEENAAGDSATEALALLETGRAVLIGQALDVRGDIALLRHHHPGLAQRLVDARAALHLPDHDGETGEAVEESLVSQALPPRDGGYLSEELAEVLRTIRRQPGFSSFAMPPTFQSLTAQAVEGPVVVYNISAYRSDALIITQHGITNVALEALTPEAVRHQVRTFRDNLVQATAPHASAVQRKKAQERLHAGLGWLWDNAAGPVLRHLGINESHTTTAPWPRVRWIPGGLLGQLPLHAAGHHADSPAAPDRRTVLDRVVSSYSPSVRALDYSRARSRSQHRSADKALVVSMPTTPGVDAPLACADLEAELVRTQLPGSLHLDVATRTQVMAHIADYPIVHFACHAVCHPVDPSHSILLLADHATAPMTVEHLNSLILAQNQLAYLSACSTASTTVDTLLDEAIHLTSAFQVAGFPHVIGTLWEVGDESALSVATAFYNHLSASGTTRDSALALHLALRALRDRYPRLVSTWAAHLHTGA